MTRRYGWPTAALLLWGLSSATLLSAAQSVPPGFTEVRPVTRSAGAPPLQLARTAFFTYALPPGWRVAEEGQFALVLQAPDQRAITVMVGNAGMPPGYNPGQFAYEKLQAIRPQNLQLGQPRPARPIAGFAQAWEFPVRYVAGGAPCEGLVRVHVQPAYDTAVMAMTAALSDARQWPGYASWLPLVSEQVAATNGAAFGMRGLMAQNLQNSTAYAEAARSYRDWSQRTQQATTDARNASNDRNQREFREALGGVQTFANPYDSRTPVELPDSSKYYWVNERGTIIGTDNPVVDPNSGSTHDWRRMPKRAP